MPLLLQSCRTWDANSFSRRSWLPASILKIKTAAIFPYDKKRLEFLEKFYLQPGTKVAKDILHQYYYQEVIDILKAPKENIFACGKSWFS